MSRPFHRIRSGLILAPWVIGSVLGLSAHGQEPLRVAIFPFQFHAKESLDYLQDAIFVTISGRLIESGEIEVVERRTLAKALPGGGASEITVEMARKIAEKFNAHYAIVGDLAKVGEFVNVDARLVGIGKPGPPLGLSSQYRGLEDAMDGLAEFADRIQRRLVLASTTPEEEEKPPEKSTIGSLYEKVVEGIRGEKPPPPQAPRGLESLQTLPTSLRGVGVGDVDGDGSKEIVLMDSNTLWIYKQTGGRLRLFRKIEGHRNDKFLTLDVADVNRNGLSEIIVSNLRSALLRSFILEFEEKRIRKVSDREPWFLRVIDSPTTGLRLVGQKMGVDRSPFGGIYSFTWKDKGFHPEQQPLMKKEIPVFGFNIGDVEGRGEASVVYMDYHDRLRVLNREGAYRWESRTSYGGSDISYSLSSAAEGEQKRVYIPPRLLLKDLDGDGASEVIVSRNTFKLNIVTRLRMYDRASLVDLAWQGLGLSESWGTPEISGHISDYQIADVDNDRRDEIVITAVSKGPLRSGASSSLLVYELF